MLQRTIFLVSGDALYSLVMESGQHLVSMCSKLACIIIFFYSGHGTNWYSYRNKNPSDQYSDD